MDDDHGEYYRRERVRGIVVLVRLERLHLPRDCAACGSPATTRLLVSRRFRSGPLVSVPCCGACWLRGRRWSRKLTNFAFAGLAASVVAGTVGFFVELRFLAVIAIASGAAALAAGALLYLFSRLAAGGQAWPPVQIVSSNQSTVVLFCASEKWGNDLAELSGGKRLQRARRFHRLSTVGIAACALLGLLVALVSWREAHALVRVDNASKVPLMIWIDGRRYQVVPPNTNGAPPPELWIRAGRHELGYSEAEEPAPRSRVVVGVPTTQSLYNPGRTACYWRLETVYAKSWFPAKAGTDIALERSEFYRLPEVDDWFRQSPASVQVSSTSPGEKRVALIRNQDCTTLVGFGCRESVLDELTACQRQASAAAGFQECFETAAAACGLTRKDGSK